MLCVFKLPTWEGVLWWPLEDGLDQLEVLTTHWSS